MPNTTHFEAETMQVSVNDLFDDELVTRERAVSIFGVTTASLSRWESEGFVNRYQLGTVPCYSWNQLRPCVERFRFSSSVEAS